MTWQSRIKRAATRLSMLGLLWGGWEFLRTQRIAVGQPYLEKELECCGQAVETTSLLAVEMERDPETVQRV